MKNQFHYLLFNFVPNDFFRFHFIVLCFYVISNIQFDSISILNLMAFQSFCFLIMIQFFYHYHLILLKIKYFYKIQFYIFDERAPLHLAVEIGDIDIIKLLLQQNEINVNAEDEIKT